VAALHTSACRSGGEHLSKRDRLTHWSRDDHPNQGGALNAKRKTGAAVAAVAAIGLFAFATSLASASPAELSRSTATYTIGEVFFQADPFQVALQTWAKKWAKQKNIKLITCTQTTAEVGINCINNWVAQGVDGIIYAPADPAAAVKPVQDAQAANVPIIGVVIKPNAPAKLPFVAVNERKLTFKAGVTAARQAKKLFPGQPLGVVALDLVNLPICKRDRMGGFIAGVKSVDRTAKVYDLGAKGDRLDATNKTADLIQSGRKFNIITGCTGEMIQGALAALKSAGRAKAVNKRPQTEYVFAIDGDKVQLQQLLDKASPVMQSMGLTPREQALRQLNLVLEIINGKTAPTSSKTIIAGAQLISTNCSAVNSYLKKQYLQKALPCK
jgi:ribose transport system substrate-binding protein